MNGDQIEVQHHSALDGISQQDWDACACPEAIDGLPPCDPFTTYRFLKALEDSGSVGAGTGWHPRYLTAHSEGQIIACAPLYAKSHSQGEYVFDHNWAHAYEGAGGRYYPKLQIAVPFTPVAGRRFLTRPGFAAVGRSALVQGAIQIASENNLSSVNITFCDDAEAAVGQNMGLLHRTGQQFHWVNDTYPDFAAFLLTLSARKRKNIKRERARAQNFGGEVVCLSGDQIQPKHWDAMWQFYQDTGSRKWGTPYLTRAFFDQVHAHLRDDILLIFAMREGIPVAGAMNMIGRDVLFGRYWGCIEDHDCLHFEICYYQAIDWAIKHGLARVEAGAQGEHKLARGYLPVQTHSLHWIADAGFSEAVSKYLVAERDAVAEEIEVLTSYGPFKNTRIQDHE